MSLYKVGAGTITASRISQVLSRGYVAAPSLISPEPHRHAPARLSFIAGLDCYVQARVIIRFKLGRLQNIGPNYLQGPTRTARSYSHSQDPARTCKILLALTATKISAMVECIIHRERYRDRSKYKYTVKGL